MSALPASMKRPTSRPSERFTEKAFASAGFAVMVSAVAEQSRRDTAQHIYIRQWCFDSMRKRVSIGLLLLALLVLCALLMAAESKKTVALGGGEGSVLLGQISNNSTANSSINISKNASGVSLGGAEGSAQFRDLENASKNLSDWGSEPPQAPAAPNYDARAAQTYYVLRLNHAGY